ncbi:MAG TPA: DUF4258 domain-containing protein [Nitrospiria bacterium]|nr:DUF4258 domain-containing protein [Nitrospiria bacterium]
MKEIEIIPLAKKKMGRRSVSDEWVDETLNSPEQVVEGYGGRKVAHRRYKVRGKDRLLRVVFEETPEKYIVITAYLTSAVKRYWKEDR